MNWMAITFGSYDDRVKEGEAMALLKDSAFSMIGKTYKSITALVFIMIVSRLFSATEYGTYRQAMLIGNTMNLLLLLGINETISYHYRIVNDEMKNQLISNLIFLKLIAATPLLVILYVARHKISEWMNNEYLSLYMVVIAMLSAIYIIESITESYYLGSGRAVLFSKIQIVAYTIHYFLAIIVVLMTQNVLFLIIEITGFELLKSIVSFAIIFKKEVFKWDLNWKFLKELLLFTMPIGISLIIITLNIYVDQLMISFFYLPEEFAVYNNGAMNVPIIQLLTMTVGAVVLPKLSQETKEKSFREGLKLWRTAATNTALVLITFMWLFMIFAKGYVSFIFSERYIDSVPIMRVYLLRMLIAFAIYSALLIVIDKKRLIVYIALVGLVANIVLNLVLIKTIGMIGAAIATVIVQFLSNGMEIAAVMHTTKVKLAEIFDFPKLLKIILTSGSMAIATKVIANLLPLGDVWDFFVWGSLYMLATFAVFFLTKQLDKELLVTIKKRIIFLKGA